MTIMLFINMDVLNDGHDKEENPQYLECALLIKTEHLRTFYYDRANNTILKCFKRWVFLHFLQKKNHFNSDRLLYIIGVQATFID